VPSLLFSVHKDFPLFPPTLDHVCFLLLFLFSCLWGGGHPFFVGQHHPGTTHFFFCFGDSFLPLTRFRVFSPYPLRARTLLSPLSFFLICNGTASLKLPSRRPLSPLSSAPPVILSANASPPFDVDPLYLSFMARFNDDNILSSFSLPFLDLSLTELQRLVFFWMFLSLALPPLYFNS